MRPEPLSEPPLSVAPDGATFAIPSRESERVAFAEIARAAAAHRDRGGEVVVVQGLGFVGAAVAATVAGARRADGEPWFYVIGVDLATPASYWKVEKLNAGVPPISALDDELGRLTQLAVCETQNLRATTCAEAYELADVIVVDVHLDVERPGPNERDDAAIVVELDGFASAIRAIGARMPPDALVLVETTVPIGTCERVVMPILREERDRRGIDAEVLLATAYERVTPGPNYVASIRSSPRTYAGVDEASARRARAFLERFLDAGTTLWEVDDPLSSELGKLLENSYRAANIAFIHEWTLLAEDIGVNLFEVVDAIRVRVGTHDNMRYPGLGVGGYCITKDSLLAQWGAMHLLGSDAALSTTLAALETNRRMPLHTFDLAEEVGDGTVAGKVVAVGGVAYLPDVADTRNSPTETLVDRLLEAGAEVRVHDPHVRMWPERPELTVSNDLEATLRGCDVVVLAVSYPDYRDLSAASLVDRVGAPAALVDAQNVVADGVAEDLFAAGWRVAGVGKGHWRKRGFHRGA